MPHLLNTHEIQAGLKKLDGWILLPASNAICKEWRFENFQSAMQFLQCVGELAQAHNHHPEMLSSYTKVSIQLTTHDHNGLTEKDFALAWEIDQFAG